MNKRDAKRFQKILMAERDRLGEEIRRLEEDTLYESIQESSGDLSSYAETGTDNFERETALNIANGESQLLTEVGDALRRIADGTYGVCEGCSEKIPRKRLEVFPSARYCVACQSRLERDGTL
ncbi:MAG TPA: TraR/DksA family transcriptional regulator [Candidatus Hydrogenedentes bacterium]|nr:TraR/DksA family transcriptional regulator [Candidatus Hydrogenedentota bacterium]